MINVFVDSPENPQNSEAQQNQLDKAFNTPGFLEFLGQFSDHDSFDASEANEAEVLQRFEAFKDLPVVIADYKVFLKEAIQKDLKVDMPETLFKDMEAALRKEVTENGNLELIANLKRSLKESRELPVAINNLTAQLQGMESRQSLEQQQVVLGGEIIQSERDKNRNRERQWGVAAAKEAKKQLPGIEGSLKNAETELENQKSREDAKVTQVHLAVLRDFDATIALAAQKVEATPELKAQLQASAAALDNCVKLGSELSLGKKDRKVQLEALQNSLVELAKQQQEAVKIILAVPRFKGNTQALRDILKFSPDSNRLITDAQTGVDNEKAKIAQGLLELRRLNAEFSDLNENPLRADNFRTALEAVPPDVLDPRVIRDLRARAEDLVRNIAQPDQSVEGIRGFTDEYNYDEGRFYKRAFNNLFGRTPEKRVKKEGEHLKNKRAELAARNQGVALTLRRVEDLEFQKASSQRSLQEGRAFLLKTAKDSTNIFSKATAMVERRWQKMVDVYRPMNEFLEAEKEFGAFEDSTNDETLASNYLDDDLHVSGWHRGQLKEAMQEILVEKAKFDMVKALKVLKDSEVTKTVVGVKLMGLQDSLGEFGKTERFKELRLKAMQAVANDGSVSYAKKIAVRLAIQDMEKPSFLSTLKASIQRPAGATI